MSRSNYNKLAEEKGLNFNVAVTIFLNLEGKGTQTGKFSLRARVEDLSSTLQRHAQPSPQS